jgi:outer membrane usher protein
LLLDVVINNHATGIVSDFEERGGRLYALPADLAALGFKLPAGLAGARLALDGLPGVSYRLEEASQTVYVAASASALVPTQIGPSAADTARGLKLASGLGAAANYDIQTTLTDGHLLAEALLDARVFSPWGVLSTSGILTQGAAAGIRESLRLESVYTYSDPDRLFRYRLGDVITGGLPWTRPIRLGGVQITTDFSLRPDLVTFPVPTLAGQVAVPSTIDVLVDGAQLLSRDAPPGPFEVNQLPVVTGAGDVSVVVRDALGQQSTQTLPIYASTRLLAPELESFSAEAGLVRLGYGTLSDTYRVPVASATMRRGLNDWLTLEAHGEASGGGTSLDGVRADSGGLLGGGAAVAIGHFGVLSLDGAASRFGGTGGALVSAAFERLTRRLSFSGSVQSASRRFGDIAASFGEPVPYLQLRGSLGLSLGSFGSFGLAYVGLRRAATAANAAPAATVPQPGLGNPVGLAALQPEPRVSLLSVSYSRTVWRGRAFAFATGFTDFANRSSAGLVAGISFALGSRGTVSVDAGAQGLGLGGYATVEASRPAAEIGQAGGEVAATFGQPGRQMAIGEYRAPWMLVDAGMDRQAGQMSWRATAQGAVAAMDGELFAANTIADSFAVVDASGTAGVPVLLENRPVGATGPDGLLLVPDLRSFEANRLAIDPDTLPMDVSVGDISRLVRPQDRSGVVVRFAVRRHRGALLRLVDGAGMALPVGSIARLRETPLGHEVAVGYDGEVFITGLAVRNTLVVTLPDGGGCRAVFGYAPVAGELPRIGPVPCVAAAR